MKDNSFKQRFVQSTKRLGIGKGMVIFMAKFIYKLQNILGIKIKLEDQAKSAYSAAKVKLDLEEEKLAQIEKKRDAYEEELRGCMVSGLNIINIKRCEDAIEITKYAIALQKVAVQNAQIQLKRAQAVLNQAMIERKTHEKLRERAFEQFMIEINQEERKEVDELVSFKYSLADDNEVN